LVLPPPGRPQRAALDAALAGVEVHVGAIATGWDVVMRLVELGVGLATYIMTAAVFRSTIAFRSLRSARRWNCHYALDSGPPGREQVCGRLPPLRRVLPLVRLRGTLSRPQLGREGTGRGQSAGGCDGPSRGSGQGDHPKGVGVKPSVLSSSHSNG
jgi:hypothetical protein